jgi:ribosomal protein S7
MQTYSNLVKKLGKKFSSQSRGENIALTTLRYLKLVNKKLNPKILLQKAIERLNTGIKIISQVKAGRTIYLPAYQSKSSSEYYAFSWIYKAAGERSTKGFKSKYLATEIRDVLLNRGRTTKYKYDHIKLIRDSRMNSRKRKLKKLSVKNIVYIRRYWHPFNKRWIYPNSKIAKTRIINLKNHPRSEKNNNNNIKSVDLPVVENPTNPNDKWFHVRNII